MSTKRQIPLEPRKTPVQARSTVTVEAIYEATFQVLLAVGGPERLTTTRVAERAGVSVGTLYQYFPNKQSLLFSVLETSASCHSFDAGNRPEYQIRRPAVHKSYAYFSDGGGNTSRSRSWGLAKDGAFIAKAVSPALPGLPDECSCPNLKGQRREVTASDNSILG
jgi:AcrR family transcriptional regulator